MAATGFWSLRRGSAAGIYGRAVCRRDPLGEDSGKMAASAVLRILENCGENVGAFPASGEKNFEKSENFVCICGKMGYNKME